MIHVLEGWVKRLAILKLRLEYLYEKATMIAVQIDGEIVEKVV